MGFKVVAHYSLENARKDTCIDGTPYLGLDTQISEWAMARALLEFPIGSSITEDEYMAACEWAADIQTLDSLVDKGLAVSYWDGEKVSYKLNTIG